MFTSPEVIGRSQNKSKTMNWPAPVRGLIRNENPAFSKAGGAEVLENFFPTTESIITRRGTRLHATLAGSTATKAVMAYGQSALFAANDSGIFDITSPADPLAALTAESGIGTSTSGDYSYVQFATSGGQFLVCVNGTNLHKVYDGSAWAENTPAITGTVTSSWSHIWSYANRIFGVKKNSLTAVYLGVDVIGGATTDFPLGGVFKLGGELLFGATWSVDSGEGLDDLCVFVSDLGEVAVYSGADPASWSLQGVYKIGKPMGKRAWFKAGGDLVIATDDGLVPLSAAVSKDRVALQQAAVSFPIEEFWLNQTATRKSIEWQCATWPQKQMLIVATPTYGGASAQVLVVNMRTGAWTVFKGGYDCRGIAQFGESLYFGTSGPTVFEAESGASDNGANYTCRAAGLFTSVKAPALQKISKLMRGTFLSSYQAIYPQFSVSTDLNTQWPTPPSSAPEPESSGLWGTAEWGAFVWGGSTNVYRNRDWQSVDGVGDFISWQCQVTLGNTAPPDIELYAVDYVYETGEAVA